MEAISGDKAFLLKRGDGLYTERWNGFWIPPYKILDGFIIGFRKNGKVYWQDELEHEEHKYDRITGRHLFRKDGSVLEKETFVPEEEKDLFIDISGRNFDSMLIALYPNLNSENFEHGIESVFSSFE
jgi:hypothetical protein